jgi:predicted DNA-binding helix-hairpin-helix protein
MELPRKLEILADAAKYDASCASSGAARKDSRASGGIGSTGGAGICHSYTPDGRCVSLLKVLLTNSCIYDCHYCINRRSSNVQRARCWKQRNSRSNPNPKTPIWNHSAS